MKELKRNLLSTTVISAVVAVGLGVGGAALVATSSALAACGAKAACNPCAAKKKQCNPCAAKACNPCGGKVIKASACSPCGAKKGCNPCAAKACNPCNPCGAKSAVKYSTSCMVPRLQTASLCNPCAAKKGCNPCAAKACNPCGGKVVKASACNPCATKTASACNPCATKNACNPCAAKKGCNPCAASACNPCNPCAAAAAAEVDLTDAEAKLAYNCIIKEMQAGYAKSGMKVAAQYVSWKSYATRAYQSATHGGRFVQNFANAKAKNYGKFEDAGKMRHGAQLTKNSFAAMPDGKLAAGPLFLMEKMKTGWNIESGDWKYTMVMADGSTFGETKGTNAAGMQFCIECHASAEDEDYMLFIPDEYRVTSN